MRVVNIIYILDLFVYFCKKSCICSQNSNHHISEHFSRVFLLRQKVHQIISVIKTNTCGFVVFKTKREIKCKNEVETQSVCFQYWDYLTNFWRNNWQSIIDVVERLCFRERALMTSNFRVSRFINILLKSNCLSKYYPAQVSS